jgi:hypothetical protein
MCGLQRTSEQGGRAPLPRLFRSLAARAERAEPGARPPVAPRVRRAYRSEEWGAGMSVVWIVSEPCGCPVLRTLDKETAVDLAKARGLILDAISARSEDAEQRALGGAVGCQCEEQLYTDDRQ